MSKCKFCTIEVNSHGQYEYVGENFDFFKHIDGKHQNIEAYLFDDPDSESFVIQIEGTHIDIKVLVKYCPFCGKKLQ